MTVGRLCVRDVDVAKVEDSVESVAKTMQHRHVGSVVVVDSAGSAPVGIVTDRDLVVRVVAAGLEPNRTTVGAVMSSELAVVDESAALEDALSLMRSSGHRRLLVCSDGGALVGLITMDDVLVLLAQEFADIGQLVEDQAVFSKAYASRSDDE